MIKFHHNKTLLFLLVTAFLTVQWTAAHIHLEKHHDHGGNNHQHNVQAHAHYSTNHHSDTIDSAHEIENYNVVDLGNDCVLPRYTKLDDFSIVSISIAHQFLFAPLFNRVQLPKLDSNRQSYITYSTIRLRAPPQFS